MVVTYVCGVDDADGALDTPQLFVRDAIRLHLLEKTLRSRHLAHPVGLEPDRLSGPYPLSCLPEARRVESLVMQIIRRGKIHSGY